MPLISIPSLKECGCEMAIINVPFLHVPFNSTFHIIFTIYHYAWEDQRKLQVYISLCTEQYLNIAKIRIEHCIRMTSIVDNLLDSIDGYCTQYKYVEVSINSCAKRMCIIQMYGQCSNTACR